MSSLSVNASRAVKRGIGVSPGTAHGPALIIGPARRYDVGEPPPNDLAAAAARIDAALNEVAEALDRRAGSAAGSGRSILTATATLARDPGLRSGIERRLASGDGETRAVHEAVEEYCTMFASSGGYLAERVADLVDVRDRTIARLLGAPEPGIPWLREPSVLVAHDLAPAEAATLDPSSVIGLVTEVGGPTSHTAILAAQLGIPAVVQVSGATDISTGDLVALDGVGGDVIVSPSEEDLAELTERTRRRGLALAGTNGRGVTLDGHPVALLANVASLDDAEAAATLEVEGCGLVRTEFLFLDRDSAPSLEEQSRTYADILRAFGGRPVVIRTLDAGADKPLAFAGQPSEANPALGRRGLRLTMSREDLLETQLDAIALACEDTGVTASVMAPMVSTATEAAWFAERAREAGIARVGVMIEVPAAAIRSRDILAEVDFGSVGTNDLQQYVMAADRMAGDLAGLLSPWQPAALDMVRLACDGARATGKPVGVCGEAAGDPLMALVLAGLGVTSLSMVSRRTRAVRAALHMHDWLTCQRMAFAALSTSSPDDARQAVLDQAHPGLQAIL